MNWPKHINVPWREGRCASAIVCDEPLSEYPGTPLGSDEVEYYGGHLLGESMAPSTIAHTIALHNAWVARNNSKERTQWVFEALAELARANVTIDWNSKPAFDIILKHAPVEIEDGTAPCGHPAQYLYSEDGGKRCHCLVCERNYLQETSSDEQRDLQATRIRLDATEKAHRVLCDAVVRNKADLLNIPEVVALVKQARAFLAEMAARAEDDEGTSAEKLREALKPFEDVEP